jgi:hypothetical protein
MNDGETGRRGERAVDSGCGSITFLRACPPGLVEVDPMKPRGMRDYVVRARQTSRH